MHALLMSPRLTHTHSSSCAQLEPLHTNPSRRHVEGGVARDAVGGGFRKLAITCRGSVLAEHRRPQTDPKLFVGFGSWMKAVQRVEEADVEGGPDALQVRLLHHGYLLRTVYM